MNETFLIGSLFDCSLTENQSETYSLTALWKQTIFGCKILSILQEMYHFKSSTHLGISKPDFAKIRRTTTHVLIENITHKYYWLACEPSVTYVIQKENFDVVTELTLYKNESVDIFARPMSLRSDLMELTYPIHNLFNWNFGFTIYRPENLISYRDFYGKPFSDRLWHCLYVMAIFCSILFYFFKRWEIRLVKGMHWECSFGYELLMVIGAYCQHIPPIDAVLYSRRGAYFTFFMFAYLIYTFYTSNLLCHLVNDKDSDIDVDMILNSDLDCVILEDVMWIIRNNIAASQNGNNMSENFKKVFDMKSVTILEGLKAIKSGNTALLSDYDTIQPFIRLVFENYEICGLTNIDVVASLRKYFYVSDKFPYKEEFKVAMLRMEEAGILSRLNINHLPKTECIPLTHVQTQFSQIMLPLSLLLGANVLCVIILIGEIIYYKRNKLWPYLE